MRGSVRGRDEKLLCPHIFHLWTVGIYTLKQILCSDWLSKRPRRVFICVVVQFYPWCKIYFPLFQTNSLSYIIIPKTKDKIEPQHTPNCIYVVIKKVKDK